MFLFYGAVFHLDEIGRDFHIVIDILYIIVFLKSFEHFHIDVKQLFAHFFCIVWDSLQLGAFCFYSHFIEFVRHCPEVFKCSGNHYFFIIAVDFLCTSVYHFHLKILPVYGDEGFVYRKDSFSIEDEGELTVFPEVTIKFIEYRSYIGYGSGRVVCGAFYKESYASLPVSFVGNLIVMLFLWLFLHCPSAYLLLLHFVYIF